MVFIFAVIALSCLAPFVMPTVLWHRHAEESKSAWPAVQIGTQRIEEGSYRAADVPVYGEEGAPGAVRVAAIGSWVLGAMFLPGLLLGLFGLVAAGLGLISIPGLLLAWRLGKLGKPLLYGEREAIANARGAATFAQVLNVIVLLVCLVGTMYQFTSAYRPAESLLFTIPVALYATISFVHAWYLQKAASLIEAKHAPSDAAALDAEIAAATTGVRIDPVVMENAFGTEEEVSALRDEAQRSEGRS